MSPRRARLLAWSVASFLYVATFAAYCCTAYGATTWLLGEPFTNRLATAVFALITTGVVVGAIHGIGKTRRPPHGEEG